MRFRSLAIGIIAATFFSPPTFAAPGDDEIAAIYFVRLQQFASKCASQEAIDRAWCEAYIAGVVDTIGSNRRLQEDQGSETGSTVGRTGFRRACPASVGRRYEIALSGRVYCAGTIASMRRNPNKRGPGR